MSLSVIVVSYEPGRLRLCLESLVRQPEAREIVVADCSALDPTATLAPLFPSVRFLHFAEKRSVPQLRWAALGRTSGSVVAALEARTVPAPDWCARLVRAHEQHPEAPVVGGPIAVSAPVSARGLGVYFAEYGRFAPPIAVGPADEVSGANLSYKRAALERERDLLEAGAWETLLHQRWRAQGSRAFLTDATVFFENAMSSAAAIRQRFAYGRGYAAARLPRHAWVRRAVRAAGSPLLPFVLTLRIGLGLRGKRMWRGFWRALPWVLFYNGLWAAGEMVGYAFGASGKVEIY